MADNPIMALKVPITSADGQRQFWKIAVDVQQRIEDLLHVHVLQATTTRVYRSHDENDGSAILGPERRTLITKVGMECEPRWVVFTKVDKEYEASAGSFVLAEQAVYVEPIQEYPTEEVAVVHVGGEASEEEEEEIEAIKVYPRALPQVKELKIEKSKISPSPPTPSALPVTGGASDTAELTQLFSELEMSSEPSTVLVKDPPTKTDVEPDKKAKSTSQFSVLQPSATEQPKRQKKGEPEPDKAAVTIEIKGLTIVITQKLRRFLESGLAGRIEEVPGIAKAMGEKFRNHDVNGIRIKTSQALMDLYDKDPKNFTITLKEVLGIEDSNLDCINTTALAMAVYRTKNPQTF